MDRTIAEKTRKFYIMLIKRSIEARLNPDSLVELDEI